MTNSGVQNFFRAGLCLVLLWGSACSLAPWIPAGGSVVLQLGSPAQRTLNPNTDTTPAAWDLQASGPSGASLTYTGVAAGTVLTLTDLIPGNWSFAVQAYTTAGAPLLTGSGSTTVASGGLAILVLTTNLVSGTGNLSLTLNWDPALGAGFAGQVTIDPDSGSPLTYSAANGTTYTTNSLPAGFHDIEVLLTDGATIAWGERQVIRILDSVTTAAGANLTGTTPTAISGLLTSGKTPVAPFDAGLALPAGQVIVATPFTLTTAPGPAPLGTADYAVYTVVVRGQKYQAAESLTIMPINGVVPGDTTPPTAGPVPTGNISAGNTAILSWSPATDDVTTAANLEYMVRWSPYSFTTDPVASLTTGAGTSWTVGLTTGNVPNLAPGSTTHFAVLVRDQAGNMAQYPALVLTAQPLLIYVEPAGSDSTGTGTTGAPFQTIERALQEAQTAVTTYGTATRGTIAIAAGSYTTVTGLTLVDGFSLEGGYNPGVWDRTPYANVTSITLSGTNATLVGISASNLTAQAALDGLTVTVNNSNGNGTTGINLSYSPLISVNNCTISGTAGNGNAYGILVSGDYNAKITNSTITAPTGSRYGYGIKFTGATSATAKIHNCVISTDDTINMDSIAIAWESGTYNLTIRNNTLRFGNSGGGGIGIGQSFYSSTSSVQLTVENNLIWSKSTNLSNRYAISGGLGSAGGAATILSIRNNNFFDIDCVYDWLGGPNLTTVAVLEAAFGGNTTGNLNLPMIGLGYFVNDTADFHLNAVTPDQIDLGGLVGSSLGWNFSDNRDGAVRTGSWSIGAY